MHVPFSTFSSTFEGPSTSSPQDLGRVRRQGGPLISLVVPSRSLFEQFLQISSSNRAPSVTDGRLTCLSRKPSQGPKARAYQDGQQGRTNTTRGGVRSPNAERWHCEQIIPSRTTARCERAHEEPLQKILVVRSVLISLPGERASTNVKQIVLFL